MSDCTENYANNMQHHRLLKYDNRSLVIIKIVIFHGYVNTVSLILAIETAYIICYVLYNIYDMDAQLAYACILISII